MLGANVFRLWSSLLPIVFVEGAFHAYLRLHQYTFSSTLSTSRYPKILHAIYAPATTLKPCSRIQIGRNSNRSVLTGRRPSLCPAGLVTWSAASKSKYLTGISTAILKTTEVACFTGSSAMACLSSRTLSPNARLHRSDSQWVNNHAIRV